MSSSKRVDLGRRLILLGGGCRGTRIRCTLPWVKKRETNVYCTLSFKPFKRSSIERLRSPPEPLVARSYLQFLRKYKWLLITTSLAGAIVAATSAFRAIPIYSASAKLLIERAAPQVVKVHEVLPTEAAGAADYYPTQYGILKSASLAREVVTKLALQQHPEFVGTPEEKSFDLLGSIQGG